MDLEIIESKLKIISDTLQKIAWHKVNNSWDHSKEYYLGDGSEPI